MEWIELRNLACSHEIKEVGVVFPVLKMFSCYRHKRTIIWLGSYWHGCNRSQGCGRKALLEQLPTMVRIKQKRSLYESNDLEIQLGFQASVR
ncbi:UPF0744 protein [Dirofilaria immitis]